MSHGTRTLLVLLGIGLLATGSVPGSEVRPDLVPGVRSGPGFPASPPAEDTLFRRSGASVGLSGLSRRVESCGAGCTGVIYVWSERMPLSLSGVAPVAVAAREVGVELTLVEHELLAAYAEGEAGRTESRASVAGFGAGDRRIADGLLASGALAHAPALVMHAQGRLLPPAILGYKTSEAYASAFRRRLSDREEAREKGDSSDGGEQERLDGGDSASSPGPVAELAPRFQAVVEHDAVGRPGAYFRWVPGRQAIAYESRGDVYLLDLSDGVSREAPGYVDFVPSPDGRFFVTPAPRRRGMEFYDAGEVYEAVSVGEPERADPFFIDRRMQDQYPSVGILEQEGAAAGERPETAAAEETRRTVYRVLTSWFEGLRYRDYEASGTADGSPEIRPVAARVEPCREKQLSIPIMSQDGGEVAARDESTGTTKIFRLLEGGRCEEVSDLGVQTGKVAWHWSGRLLAFARPSLRARIGPGFMPGRVPGGSRSGPGGERPDADLEAADGIFLYDRDSGRMTRVPDSEDASSLAFPEFIGDDRLVYLVPGESGEPSVFRVVQGRW